MFVQKLYQTHLKKTGEPGRDVFLGKPRTSSDQFTVYHFADKVVYNMGGFLEKNMDRVAPEHVAILKGSGRSFVADLFQAVSSGEGEERKQKRGLLGRRGGGRAGAGQGRTLVGPSVGAQVGTCVCINHIVWDSMYIYCCYVRTYRLPSTCMTVT